MRKFLNRHAQTIAALALIVGIAIPAVCLEVSKDVVLIVFTIIWALCVIPCSTLALWTALRLPQTEFYQQRVRELLYLDMGLAAAGAILGLLVEMGWFDVILPK